MEMSIIMLTVSSKHFHVLSGKVVSSVIGAALISSLTVRHKPFGHSSVSWWGQTAMLWALLSAAGGAPGLKTVYVFTAVSFPVLCCVPHNVFLLIFPRVPPFLCFFLSDLVLFSFQL